MTLMAQMISLAGKASDPDTMTLDEALAKPGWGEFIKSMYKELSNLIEQIHWKVMSLTNVPKHNKSIPLVWLMKHKCNSMGEIIKWEVQLYAGGHKSMDSIEYWSTN